MKRALALLLSVLTLLTCLPVASAAQYPAVRIDPQTGKPYDLEGRTIYIYDYWSGEGERDSEPNAEQQATYDYQDWLMKTYNCTIIQKQKGDWLTNGNEFSAFVNEPDGSLCVFIIEPGTGTRLGTQNNLAADWSISTSIDLNDEHWHKPTLDLFTINGGIYGAITGKGEPRQVLYFNKRLLEEAGIDWNTLYDAQKNGTWTWAKFEDMLEKTTRDLDNDGVNDIWGITGSTDDLYNCAVFTNGGRYFSMSSAGKLVPVVNSEKTVSALNWAEKLWNNYARQALDGDNWDYYKTVFKEGGAVFYMYQTYGGFNDYSELSDMEDEWGAVAFPLPNGGTNYLNITSNNIAIIPNVYTDEEISMITLIYDLWTRPTPGYDSEDAWIGNKYNYTDKRAVDETYAMLRKPEHQICDETLLIGSNFEVLGPSLLWGLANGNAQELADAAMPDWQATCDALNFNKSNRTKLDLSGYTTIELPADLTAVTQQSLAGTAAQVVVIPEGCTAIESKAFANTSNLKYIVIPASVATISSDALSSIPAGTKVLLYKNSAAQTFCQAHGISYSVLLNNTGYTTQVWTISK